MSNISNFNLMDLSVKISLKMKNISIQEMIKKSNNPSHLKYKMNRENTITGNINLVISKIEMCHNLNIK